MWLTGSGFSERVFLNCLFVVAFLQVAHHRLEGSSSYETVTLEKIRNSTELQWSFFTTKGVLRATILVPALRNTLTCHVKERSDASHGRVAWNTPGTTLTQNAEGNVFGTVRFDPRKRWLSQHKRINRHKPHLRTRTDEASSYHKGNSQSSERDLPSQNANTHALSLTVLVDLLSTHSHGKYKQEH